MDEQFLGARARSGTKDLGLLILHIFRHIPIPMLIIQVERTVRFRYQTPQMLQFYPLRPDRIVFPWKS